MLLKISLSKIPANLLSKYAPSVRIAYRLSAGHSRLDFTLLQFGIFTFLNITS